jgi:phosphorylcholine metabolism protein LicD
MDHECGERLILAIANILDSLRVPYFLIQGTALGAYRDQGFTPTEKDIDIGFLQENMSSYTALSLVSLVTNTLHLDVEVFVKPMTVSRTFVIWGDGAKLDLVGFSKKNNQRYTIIPVRPWITEPYALVHEATILETYEKVSVWGREWDVPSPIETYLKREYGNQWLVPVEDHVSRTRVYGSYEDLLEH